MRSPISLVKFVPEEIIVSYNIFCPIQGDTSHIAHLVSSEIHVTVRARHAGERTLLFMALHGHKNHIMKEICLQLIQQLCDFPIQEPILPLSPRRQKFLHSQDMRQVSFCTQQIYAPPKWSFSQTVGNVDKAQWQTHNVPNDSGEREMMASTLILYQEMSHSSGTPEDKDII